MLMLLLSLVLGIGLLETSASSSFAWPKEWSRGRLVAGKPRTDDQPPVYLVQYMYPWGSNCENEAERTESFAFGACIGGLDESGNPSTSMQSVLLTANDSMVTYLSNTYKSFDCTGTPIYSYTAKQVMNQCDSVSSKFVLTDAKDSTPWAGANSGVLVKTFPPTTNVNESAVCTGYPEVFQAISFNYCMGYQSKDFPSVTNMRYTACDTDSVTYTMYSNYNCNADNTVHTVTFASNTCRICPNTETNCYPQGFWYENYESIVCDA